MSFILYVILKTSGVEVENGRPCDLSIGVLIVCTLGSDECCFWADAGLGLGHYSCHVCIWGTSLWVGMSAMVSASDDFRKVSTTTLSMNDDDCFLR
jgi:hypothetical protein